MSIIFLLRAGVTTGAFTKYGRRRAYGRHCQWGRSTKDETSCCESRSSCTYSRSRNLQVETRSVQKPNTLQHRTRGSIQHEVRKRDSRTSQQEARPPGAGALADPEIPIWKTRRHIGKAHNQHAPLANVNSYVRAELSPGAWNRGSPSSRLLQRPDRGGQVMPRGRALL